MPEITSIPLIPYEDIERAPLTAPMEELKNTLALELVKRTFDSYQNYRTMNHDARFVTQDQLYTGWVPVKTWPNTNIPRASMPCNIVFDQVESAHPSISQALFGSGQWFDVEADVGTDPKNLKQINDTLSWVIQHARNDFGGSGINELKLATKDTIYRGNGGISLEWNPVEKRPKIEWVDIRDIYMDPGLTVPNTDEAQSVIRSKRMSVREIQDLRGTPDMNIPDDDMLFTLAMDSTYQVADQTKSAQEAVRGVNYTPGDKFYEPSPADRKIEVLIFYSKDRIIWTFNRKWIAYNERNPYGFIPLCFAPCYIYPGRWYAASIPDMQEYNQRMIEALLNARLDRVHLSLEPPRLVKRSALLTPGNMRWHPGKAITVDSKDDYQMLEPQDAIPNVFTEIEFIQNLAERRTGINGFGMGVPSGGNVNRTATGVNAQTTGGSMRLLDIVENIENYLLIPMLYKLYHMISVHTTAFEKLSARNDEGQIYQVPADIFNSKVNFTINASSKMVTKDKLLQIFPFVAQYLLNGPFLQQLNAAGQTVDSMEMLRFLQDASGTAQRYNLIRSMSPEEQQQRNQPDTASQMEKASKDADNQVRLQIAQGKNQTEIQKAQIIKAPDPGEQQAQQLGFQLDQQKAQQALQQESIQNSMKMQFEQNLAKIKLDAEREKNQQQMQVKQLDHQLNVKQTLETSHVDSVAARQDMLNNQLRAHTERQQNAAKFADDLQFNKDKQKLALSKSAAPRANANQKPAKAKKKG